MKFKKIMVIAITIAMMVGLVGCGSKKSTTDQEAGSNTTETTKETTIETETTTNETKTEQGNETTTLNLADLKIAYVPTTMNNPFWTAMMKGIKDEMIAKGMNPDTQLITVDAESDQAKMNNYIYDLINQKVDVIIMAPMDCTACTEALQACADANIPVINVDTPVDRTDLVVSVIASDNYKAGVECAQDMMKRLEKGSKIYIMNQPSGTACVQREQGFIDTAGDYFEIVGTFDTSGDTAKTLPVAEDAITANSDLAAFFCINDMGALGCVKACQAANRTDILIYGVDGNPDFMSYVAEGLATGSAAQQPSVIGSSAVDTAIKYLSGETVEANIVVPVEMITQDNISQFDITDWQ